MAGPIVIGMAYGVRALLTGGDAASETADAGMSLAYGLLLWVGAPIAFVAALPLLAGTLKFFTMSEQSPAESPANACDRRALVRSAQARSLKESIRC